MPYKTCCSNFLKKIEEQEDCSIGEISFIKGICNKCEKAFFIQKELKKIDDHRNIIKCRECGKDLAKMILGVLFCAEEDIGYFLCRNCGAKKHLNE